MRDQVQLPNRDQAEAIIEPVKELIRKAITKAYEDWDSDYAHVRHVLGPRAQSGIIHDHIVHHAQYLLASVPDVKTIKKKGIFTVSVDGADIRFKKLDRRLRSHNVRTRQQTRNTSQLKLPGFKDTPRLTAGYVLDDTRTSIETMVVTLQVGREVQYAVPLMNAEQSVFTFYNNSPVAPARKRVRAKSTDHEQVTG